MKSELIQIFWEVVDNFLKDWQEQPFRWFQEINVQAELARRFSMLLELLGEHIIVANYKEYEDLCPNNQLWSRVACGPTVKGPWIDGELCNYRPDIVIWDDIEDLNSPPERYPIFLACEIKCGYGDIKGDIDKLRMLTKDQQNPIRFGCFINLLRSRSKTEKSITWREDEEVANLRIYEAFFPPI